MQIMHVSTSSIIFDPKSLMICRMKMKCCWVRSHFIRVPMNFNNLLGKKEKPQSNVKITAVICNSIKQNKTGWRIVSSVALRTFDIMTPKVPGVGTFDHFIIKVQLFVMCKCQDLKLPVDVCPNLDFPNLLYPNRFLVDMSPSCRPSQPITGELLSSIKPFSYTIL